MPKRKSSHDRRKTTSERVRKMRKDVEVKHAERERDRITKVAKRFDCKRRCIEQERNALTHQTMRQDPDYRMAEQARNTSNHQTLRQDPHYRMNEQARNTSNHKTMRQDPHYRMNEQTRNTSNHQTMRQDPNYRIHEQARDTFNHQSMREDPGYRIHEQARDTVSHQSTRQDPDFRMNEQARDTVNRRVLRASSEYRVMENLRRVERAQAFDVLLNEYEERVKQGPTLVCSSCGGLWYKLSMRSTSVEELAKKGLSEIFVKSVLYIDQLPHYLCGTCWNSISKTPPTIPRLNLANGFDFTVIPNELKDLTALEERLVSLRLPFMQIRTLGSGRQCGLRGNIVNVLNDLDTTAKILPRRFDESSVVQVMLMRRLCYKAPFMYETVRPLSVYRAAKYLANSELYKAEGVVLSHDWELSSNDPIDFVVDERDKEQVKEIMKEINEEETVVSVKENKSEAEEELEQETMVLAESDRNGEIIRIAPGEGKRPLSLLRDLDAEVLSFPKIYGGVKRSFPPALKISITDIAKSEARRYDRRCCTPAKILYTYKLMQNSRVRDAIQLCLRKKKGGQSVTAGELRSDSYVSTLVQHDDGYRMLKNIRGSPAYWEMQLKNVMAMLRQLDIPTFFITLSAAETKWEELLSNLNLILHGTKLTNEQVQNLSFKEKSELIRNDPVTCARNFDHRFRALLNTLLKKPGGIFEQYKLLDYFLRDEFQMRGSPHNHGIYWLQDAPKYVESDQNSQLKCVKFIDQYITCERNDTEEMEKLIQYQIHKHSHTCKRLVKGETVCRFGFPIPPMQETTILFPIEKDSSDTILKVARESFKHIKDMLKQNGRDFKDDIPWKEFLAGLKLSEEEYLLAVRSSIRRPSVYLKRSTNATFINPYNEDLLKAWRANMDIQFILDPYSCAKYCVSYLAKDESGISKLLRKINEECRAGNHSVKDRLRKFANTFTNFVEISAQEAAYGVLGIPLIRSSTVVDYINTSPPEDRVFLVKSREELESLASDSTDISTLSVLNRYSSRPEQLSDLCLADFVALFNFSKSKRGKNNQEDCQEQEDDEISHPQTDSLNPWITLGPNNGWLQKRRRPKVIRFRRYGEKQDPVNYMREQIMLYVPWRDEHADILDQPIIKLYEENKSRIQEAWERYDCKGISEDVDDYKDDEETDHSHQVIDDEFKVMFDSDTKTDIFQDMGLTDQNAKFDYIKSPKNVPDDEYWKIVRSLNNEQRKYFLHLIHKLKGAEEPFYELLHGGAGVGKSHLIFALVQTLVRYQSKRPGQNPGDITVLVAAFTGKAACNVFGITLHSAFRLPNSQNSSDIVRLVEDVCNSLRSKLLHLKLIVIDEISMVSVKQLFQIDSRLRQVFQCEQPFGGISILAVGHFRQLKPVMASYIFAVPKFKLMGCTTGNTLWPLFKCFEFTEVMRQKGQHRFCTALNNMAEGVMTEEDVALIRARQISDTLIPPADAIRLFYSNADCHNYNISFQAKLNTEHALSTAVDRIQGTATEQQKVKLLESAKNLKVGDSDGLPYEVHLQVGADYFISTNVDVSDGLFNGCTGTLMRIDYGITSTNERIPIRAWLNLNDTNAGAAARSRTLNYQIQKGIDSTWTAVDLQTRVLSRTLRHRHQVVRKQIPLVDANAVTFHKSQSSSLKNVVVCVKKKLTRELLYVGCSRATHYEGLFIDGDFEPPSKPSPDDPVTVELTRLRQNRVQLSLQFLQDYDDSSYKFIFHNVQSLHKHYEDVISDPCYQASDLIAFVEPWSLPFDQYPIDGFHYIIREDCQNTRTSTGAIVYARECLFERVINPNCFAASSSDGHYIFATWTFDRIVFIVVYRSPNSNLKSFYVSLRNVLEQFPEDALVVVGDFNIDLKKSDSKELFELFQRYGLKSRLGRDCPTTDGGSQIDVCFSNVLEVDCWTFESVFSYHKPLCVTWPKPTSGKLPVDPFETPEPMDCSCSGDITEGFTKLDLGFSKATILEHANQIMEGIRKHTDTANIGCIRNEVLSSPIIEHVFSLLKNLEICINTQHPTDFRSTQLLPRPLLQHYTPMNTAADGNCFYNAISISLFGVEKYHPVVRLGILADILNWEEEYRCFLRLSLAGYSYEDFVINNAKCGDWADSSIMYVASKVCGRPIHCYDMEFGGLKSITFVDGFCNRLINPEKGDTRHHLYLFDSNDSAKKPICVHYRNMIDGGANNHPKKSSSVVFPCTLDVYGSLRNFGSV